MSSARPMTRCTVLLRPCSPKTSIGLSRRRTSLTLARCGSIVSTPSTLTCHLAGLSNLGLDVSWASTRLKSECSACCETGCGMLTHRCVAIRTSRLSTLTLDLRCEGRIGEKREEKRRVDCITNIEVNEGRQLNLCISIVQSFDMELSLKAMICRLIRN